MAALPDSLLTPLQGGVFIEVDGKVVGAIGVSGVASAQQDEEIAIAAVNAEAVADCAKSKAAWFAVCEFASVSAADVLALANAA